MVPVVPQFQSIQGSRGFRVLVVSGFQRFSRFQSLKAFLFWSFKVQEEKGFKLFQWFRIPVVSGFQSSRVSRILEGSGF